MEIIKKPYIACKVLDCDLNCSTISCSNLCGYLDKPFLEVFEVLPKVLVECGAEFFTACKIFIKEIGPICPFDPVIRAKEYFINQRFDILETKVKEISMETGKK